MRAAASQGSRVAAAASDAAHPARAVHVIGLMRRVRLVTGLKVGIYINRIAGHGLACSLASSPCLPTQPASHGDGHRIPKEAAARVRHIRTRHFNLIAGSSPRKAVTRKSAHCGSQGPARGSHHWARTTPIPRPAVKVAIRRSAPYLTDEVRSSKRAAPSSSYAALDSQ
jgi:hypothetical protein